LNVWCSGTGSYEPTYRPYRPSGRAREMDPKRSPAAADGDSGHRPNICHSITRVSTPPWRILTIHLGLTRRHAARELPPRTIGRSSCSLSSVAPPIADALSSLPCWLLDDARCQRCPSTKRWLGTVQIPGSGATLLVSRWIPPFLLGSACRPYLDPTSDPAVRPSVAIITPNNCKIYGWYLETVDGERRYADSHLDDMTGYRLVVADLKPATDLFPPLS